MFRDSGLCRTLVVFAVLMAFVVLLPVGLLLLKVPVHPVISVLTVIFTVAILLAVVIALVARWTCFLLSNSKGPLRQDCVCCCCFFDTVDRRSVCCEGPAVVKEWPLISEKLPSPATKDAGDEFCQVWEVSVDHRDCGCGNEIIVSFGFFEGNVTKKQAYRT